MPFRALGLDPRLLKAIADAGYTEPTPIQNKAIPAAMKGKDLVGIAQTGTGKTAAFLLPILQQMIPLLPLSDNAAERRPRALILEPTRELAVQVTDNLKVMARHLPIRFAAVFGGVSEGPQLAALRAGVDLIVATPGRLLDFMSTGSAPLYMVGHLVLDEADRMLDMGFLPDIKRIVAATPTDRQTLLFSATFSAEIESISRNFLTKPEMVEIGRRATPTDQVSQMVFEVPRTLKSALLLHLLKDESLGSVLVFCRTKIGAERLSRQLYQSGVSCSSLHSNRTQGQRLEALKGFKHGSYRVLVATDIAARGIDVDGISHVVNYDFPGQPEDYVHRIGRTGRAQAIGDAISFCSPEEVKQLKSLERFIGRGLPRRRVEDLHLSAGPRESSRRSSSGSAEAGPERPRRGRSPGGDSGPRGERGAGGRRGDPGDRPARGARSEGAPGGRAGKPARPPVTQPPTVFAPKPLDPADETAFGRGGKKPRRGRR